MRLCFFIFLLSFAVAINAQNYNDFDVDSLDTKISCSNKSLDFPLSNVGFSLGNSKNFSGIRINYSDCGVETINGINITLWRAKNFGDQVVNGISFGLIPMSKSMNGFSFGLGGLITSNSMIGFNFGGLALVSQQNIFGINFSGLASVSQNRIAGVNFSGLANVTQENIIGLTFGGLANVSQGYMLGLNVAGLANVAEENLIGFNLSSLANVSQADMLGINISGLANVSQNNLNGFNIALLANVSGQGSISGLSFTFGKIFAEQKIKGLNFAGYKTEAPEFSGINITPVWSVIENLSGFSLSIYNEIYGRQNGISIGLINFAEELHGIQIGLINIAKNKSSLKILPIINASL